jgi:hypothetical protein
MLLGRGRAARGVALPSPAGAFSVVETDEEAEIDRDAAGTDEVARWPDGPVEDERRMGPGRVVPLLPPSSDEREVLRTIEGPPRKEGADGPAEFWREITGRLPPSSELRELLRDIAGADGPLNDDGGALAAASLDARSDAALLRRGATAGARVLATVILSRRLWPGTPSNIFFWASVGVRALEGDFFEGDGSTGMPIRKLAARDIRGVSLGGAVLATSIFVVRKAWPGTSANVCARRSLETGVRGEDLTSPGIGGSSPAERDLRSAAARDMRGTMVGVTVDAGTGRALKPDRDARRVRDLFPSSPERAVDSVKREPRPELTADDRGSESASGSGSSLVGKGGDDAKRLRIWISALSSSGEPMMPFCIREMP